MATSGQDTSDRVWEVLSPDPSIYVLGPGGEQLTELANTSGTQTPTWQVAHTNVYAAGQQIATYDADLTGATEGSLYFHLSDWLGTRRQQTDYAGNPVLNFTGLPYGDGLSVVPVSSADVADATEHHFSGKERDAESGNDYFGARYYASSMGRMLSPDPVFISLDQIYDPQGLNLYAYARSNPLTITDPTGLDFYLACQTSDHSGCGQVQNGDSKVWVQGQTVNGSFQATDVDMNRAGDASAGYHDQFGNQYSGSFDENGGVSFTDTATGATSSNSRFIDGSDETDVNGSTSGAFNGIQGRFNSDCGGSCEAKGSLYDLPGLSRDMYRITPRPGGSITQGNDPQGRPVWGTFVRHIPGDPYQ